ncbi:MAG: lipoprotein signal peptidase [Xanthomonadales bacterium]|nr:lipoprotein signal peptidase [Xanthomonadales bacterium]NIX12846.1 lipoprotein signal peptidase [Xanthomonadales bacterium]
MNGTTPGRQPLIHFHSPFVWLVIAGLVIILDLYTKQWAVDTLILYRPVEVLPWLNWLLAHNYGAAFSFLSDAGGWQRWFFTVLAIVVSLVLLVWLFRLREGEWRTGLALGLVIGGAVGNLLDRLTLGYVIDFIDVHYRGLHWPAFNVADSAISCGIALLLLDALIETLRRPGDAARDDGE